MLVRGWLLVVLASVVATPAFAQLDGGVVSFEPDDGAIVLHSDEGARDTAGTFGDPLRAAMLLPGVAHLASGVAHPVVRGFQPATTDLLLDGVRVPMSFHLLAGPSVISPEFISALKLYSGDTPVADGRHLGSTLVAEVPAASKTRLVLTADLFNLGGFYQERVRQTDTRVSLAGRLGYSPLLAALAASAAGVSLLGGPATLTANFFDYQAHVEQPLGKASVRLLAFGSSSTAGAEVAGRGDTAQPYDGFHRIDLRWRQRFGKGHAEAAVTWGTEHFGMLLGGGDSFGLEAVDQLLGARGSFALDVNDRVSLTIGGDVERRTPEAILRSTLFPPEVPGSPTPDPITTETRTAIGPALLGGAYLTARYQATDALSGEASVRLDSYRIAYESTYTVEPRLSLRYALSDRTTLRASAGLYHQLPTTLIPLPVIEYERLPLGLQEVVKTEASVEHAFVERHLGAKLSVYVDPIRRAVELSPFDPHFQRQLTYDRYEMAALLSDRVQRGSSYGAELLVHGEPLPGLSGWASYALGFSQRRVNFERAGGAADSAVLSAPLEQQHLLNLVARYQLPGAWTVSANVHLNSGFPEAGNVASFTQQEGVDVAGEPSWVPVDRDQVGRMPWFWRLDARVQKEWAFPSWKLQGYLDVFNLAFSQETVRYTYGQRTDAAGTVTLERGAMKLPVLVPMLGVRAVL